MTLRIVLAAAAACLFTLALALPSATTGGTFTIAMLPDTQHYSDNAANFPLFKQQTAWLVQNRTTENIVFVTHVGDIVDNGGNTTQWTRADEAMDNIDLLLPAPFDGNIPYAAALGNHDFDVVGNKSTSSNYTSYFGAARYANKTWYVGASPDQRNSAQAFWVNGEQLLHIALEWRASDDAIAWAQEVMRAYPRVPTIVTTHEHLVPGNPATRSGNGNTLDATGDNAAGSVFRKLIEPFPQTFLVLSGHFSDGLLGYGSNGHLTSVTAFGKQVDEVVADYQSDPHGGNGWMQLLEFRPATRELSFSTFSPSYVSGITNGPDRSTDPASNFTLPNVDLQALRADLGSRTTLHFRRDQDHGFGVFGVDYGGVIDTRIGNGNSVTLPNASYATGDLRADGNDERESSLLWFQGIIGSLPGQIPPGTAIEKAVLTLTCEGTVNAHSDTGAQLHRMLVPWSESDTWNGLGNGIQIGVECESTVDAATGALFSGRSTQSFDVTASVQAWVNGVANYGWFMAPGGNDMVQFRSSDWVGLAERPMLTVRYVDPCPPATRYCTKTANSASASGASISSSGSTSIGQNDFTLHADPTPPFKATIFFYGALRTLLPFHDGVRCIANPIFRLGPVVFSDASGASSLHLDFTQLPLSLGPGHVTAGSTWCFQAWYRDPQGPAGGSSNTSDAIEVRFCD